MKPFIDADTGNPVNADKPSGDREQTVGEEIANSVSHGLGLVLSWAAAPILVVHAVLHSGAAAVVGVSIFALTLALMYGASTLYHGLPAGRAKRVFNVLDHSAIYLLIAGTYTPFTLGVLKGPWGWTLFGLVWGLALLGVVMKALSRLSHPWLSTGLYLAMGWLVLIAIRPLSANLPMAGLAWLVGGGLCYTAGVVFFVFDSRWRYAHFIWHLFVVAGSVCHFFAVLWYAA